MMGLKRAMLGPAALLAVMLIPCAAIAQAWDAQAHLREFKTLTADVARAQRAGDTPPRLGGSQGQAMRRAFDVGRVRVSGMEDLDRTYAVCQAGFEVALGYFAFNIPGGLPAGELAEDSPELMAMSRNALTYQDEITLAAAFNLACVSRTVPTVSRFWLTLSPAGKTSEEPKVRRMRSGAQGSLLGALQMLSDSALRKENRALLADALKDSLPAYLQILGMADRTALLEGMAALRPDAPADTQASYDDMARAIRAAPCTDLCTV